MLHVAFHAKKAFRLVSDEKLTHVVIGRDVAIVNPGPPPKVGTKEEVAEWQAVFMEGQDKARAGLYRLKDYGWYTSRAAAELGLVMHTDKFDLAIVEVSTIG